MSLCIADIYGSTSFFFSIFSFTHRETENTSTVHVEWSRKEADVMKILFIESMATDDINAKQPVRWVSRPK